MIIGHERPDIIAGMKTGHAFHAVMDCWLVALPPTG